MRIDKSKKLIDLNQAAQMLNLSVARVRQLIKQGLILPAESYGSSIQISQQEIEDYIEVSRKGLNINELKNRCLKAELQVRRLETRLNSLEMLLGIHSKVPSFEDLESYLHDAKVALLKEEYTQEEQADWCLYLLNIQTEDLNYLDTIEKDGWKVFYDLLEKMYKIIRMGSSNLDHEQLIVVNRILDTRRSFRHTVFFFLKARNSHKEAVRFVPEALTDPIDKIMHWSCEPLKRNKAFTKHSE